MLDFKKILIGSVLGLGLLVNPLNAENVASVTSNNTQKTEFKKGYNSLEFRLLGDISPSSKMINNFTYSSGNTKLWYQGCNNFNFDSENYFGRHRFMVGSRTASTYLSVDTLCDNSGVKDVRYGVRNLSLPKALGFKGFFDVTVNRDVIDNTFLFIKPISRVLSLEWLNIFQHKRDAKDTCLVDVMIKGKLKKRTYLFGNCVYSNGNANYNLGIKCDF